MNGQEDKGRRGEGRRERCARAKGRMRFVEGDTKEKAQGSEGDAGYRINRSMAGEAAEDLAKGTRRMAGRIDRTG